MDLILWFKFWGAAQTAYHAKYYAYDLTKIGPSTHADRLSTSLFDASVDLNPHQVEAALFAIRSPLSKGVILADEVGLGKTIEAGIVLCQLWAEHKRRLLVICPAALRRQWSIELEEKFNLPSIILESDAFKSGTKKGHSPLEHDGIVIVSYQFASRYQNAVAAVRWDMAIIDEAHKLRNVYKPDNKMGKNIQAALKDCRKVLLTATPLQNSLMELYGLSSLIDEPKAERDVNTEEVKEKAAAAIRWCEAATEHELKHGGKPWRYVLIPHTEIKPSATLAGILSRFGK